MKKLILIALILGCLAGGVYYSVTQQHKEKEATTQPLLPQPKSDRAQSNTRKEENKKRAEFFKEKRVQQIIDRLKAGEKYSSIYDVLGDEFSRERAIEVAKGLIQDEDSDRSRQAIDVLLRLQDDGDYHKIISDLIKSRSDNLAYIRGLLELHYQYRVGDTDEIVKYFIDNKLYETRNDLGGILSKASKELQIEYIDTEVLNIFNSLQNRGNKLDLGIPDDTGKGYSDLIYKEPKSDLDFIKKADELFSLHKIHPETVSEEEIERILTLLETTESSRATVSRFIADYAGSGTGSQERLESILLKNKNRHVAEHVLVNLTMLFPESQIAKDYLVNELNKVTEITSPQVKYKLAALIDDPYINERAPAPQSEYETPNTSTHWNLRVRQKDRSPYIWIHNYLKDYTLPN